MHISFVIPAYNEQENIENTIQAIKSSVVKVNRVNKYEIIVVNNNSTDNTVELAKKHKCMVIDQMERSISKTRNLGAKNSMYEYVFFVDADTLISSQLLEKFILELDKGKRIVSGITCFKNYPTLSSLGVWFYNLLSYIFRLGVGQAILVEKKAFEKVGGFNQEYFAFEEINLFKKFKKAFGFDKTKVTFECINTSSRKFKGNFNVFKFVVLLFLTLLGVEVGKKKNLLDFWYGNTKNPKTPLLFYLVTLLLIADLIFLISDFNTFDPYSQYVSTVIFLILLVYSMGEYFKFLIVFIFTLLIEIIGSSTGNPFGIYQYTSLYSEVMIYGVPVFIPLAWYLIGSFASKVFNNTFFAGMFFVIFDLIIEEFAKAKYIWIWQQHDGTLIAPYTNYVSWFFIGIIIWGFLKGQKISSNNYKKGIFILIIYMSIYVLFSNITIGLLGLTTSIFLFKKYYNSSDNTGSSSS